MRNETIQLKSVNGSHLRFITLRDAFDRIADGKAKPLKDKHRKIYGVQMMELDRKEHSSPCTLTCSDAKNNAVALHPAPIGATQSIRVLERSADKVAAWPETHDSRATVISAGSAYGVFCPFPPLDSTRIVTFA